MVSVGVDFWDNCLDESFSKALFGLCPGPIFFFRITSRYSTKWRLEEYNFCSSGSSSAGRAMQQENRLEAGAVRSFRRDAGMTAGHEDRAV